MYCILTRRHLLKKLFPFYNHSMIWFRLRDESALVRKTTIMVLSHLILNDMVKVKGQISELATCIVDEETDIAGLAKRFFLELSHKVKETL